MANTYNRLRFAAQLFNKSSALPQNPVTVEEVFQFDRLWQHGGGPLVLPAGQEVAFPPAPAFGHTDTLKDFVVVIPEGAEVTIRLLDATSIQIGSEIVIDAAEGDVLFSFMGIKTYDGDTPVFATLESATALDIPFVRYGGEDT